MGAGDASRDGPPVDGRDLVASFHLVRYRRRRIPLELVRFVSQRPALHRTPGLRFARILGTAKGRSMSLSADLTRWAMFAVWDDEAALDHFLGSSSVAAHWDRVGVEAWTVRLEPLAAHGAWDGERPLGRRHGPTADVAPLAVLTRAAVRVRRWRRFYRAAAVTDDVLRQATGLLGSVGVGERPVGRQATFSLWASAADLAEFAYRTSEHTDVIRRTRDEGWYAEELFARFRPYGSTGTWAGIDPLAGAAAVIGEGDGRPGDQRAATASDRATRARSAAGTTGKSIP